MAVTIKDIARDTGLSLSTISKYLNNGKVREGNRAKIERSIAKFDFRPNEIARGLRSAKTRTVGVLVPSFRSVFSAEVVARLEEELAASGYGVFVVDAGGTRESEREKLDFLVRKMVDGVVVHPARLQASDFSELVRRKIPYVLIDQDVAGLDADKVFVDNFRSTYDAAKFLLAKGHRRIGFLGAAETGNFTAAERFRGYRAALEESGIRPKPGLVRLGGYSLECGRDGTLGALRAGATALLYSNYDLTLGGIYALNEHNVKIAEDVSVIGFDDIIFSKLVRPKLTVISQPMDEIGRAAADLVLARIAEPVRPNETRVLRTGFHENQSVKEYGLENV